MYVSLVSSSQICCTIIQPVWEFLCVFFSREKPKALPNEFVQTELLANAAKGTCPS